MDTKLNIKFKLSGKHNRNISNKVNSNDTLHIAFCVSDNFVQYICVTIKSILVNNKNLNIHIHVLCDGFSKDSKKRLYSLFKNKDLNTILTLHEVDDSSLKGLEVKSWTIYAWYRLLLPEILPNVSRVLYLDADTLVVGDLSPLINWNLREKSIGGIIDIFYRENPERLGLPIYPTYLCSGILLINLEYWRKYRVKDKIINWAHTNSSVLKYPDQDSINAICQSSSFRLPIKYGVTTPLLLKNHFYESYSTELQEAFISPVIVHYSCVWNGVPWHGSSTHYYIKYWRKYNQKLRYRAEMTYQEKGLKKLKVKIWNIFYDRGATMNNQIIRMMKSKKLLS